MYCLCGDKSHYARSVITPPQEQSVCGGDITEKGHLNGRLKQPQCATSNAHYIANHCMAELVQCFLKCVLVQPHPPRWAPNHDKGFRNG